jgi:hypothetical protein
MTQEELNDSFRNLIVELSELGYKQTNIGKILFGLSAFSQVSKFVAGINDPEKEINFGIAPLSKIGHLLDHDLHLVYIDPNDNETLNYVHQRNMAFREQLKIKVKDYLDNNISSRKANSNDPEKINKDIDEILSLLM